MRIPANIIEKDTLNSFENSSTRENVEKVLVGEELCEKDKDANKNQQSRSK